VLALLTGGFSCADVLSAQCKLNGIKAAPGTYHIDIGDQLSVSVWQHTEFSGTVDVDRDGNIVLPWGNVVKAVRLSVNELAGILTQKLSPLYPSAHITVAVGRTASPLKSAETCEPTILDTPTRPVDEINAAGHTNRFKVRNDGG